MTPNRSETYNMPTIPCHINHTTNIFVHIFFGPRVIEVSMFPMYNKCSIDVMNPKVSDKFETVFPL